MAMDSLELKKARAKALADQIVAIEVTAKGKGRAVAPTSDESRRLSVEFETLVKGMDDDRKTIEATGAPQVGDSLAILLGIEDKQFYLYSAIAFAIIVEVVSGVCYWLMAPARLQRRKIRQTTTKPPPVVPGKPRWWLGLLTRMVGRFGFGAPLSPPSPEPAPAPASNVVTFPDLAAERRAKAMSSFRENRLTRDVPEPLSTRRGDSGAARWGRDATATESPGRGPIPAPSQDGKSREAADRDDRKGSLGPTKTSLIKTSPVMAHVSAFVDERLEHAAGMSLGATELHEIYKTWCPTHGFEPLSIQKFGRELRRLGFEKWKSSGCHRYRNVQLHV